MEGEDTVGCFLEARAGKATACLIFYMVSWANDKKKRSLPGIGRLSDESHFAEFCVLE